MLHSSDLHSYRAVDIYSFPSLCFPVFHKITAHIFFQPLPGGCRLIVAGRFVCPVTTLRAMLAGAKLLVGPPKPDRSKGRDQTKSSPLVLQVGGWGIRLTT
jgi:hypothetical protein